MNRATEQQGLALQALSYTAYGHSVGGVATSLGFNGEWRIGVLRGYGLGHGHRYYRPALMRFLSPDVLSPFGKGGLNAYCYCEGDPINNTDPSGQMKRAFGRGPMKLKGGGMFPKTLEHLPNELISKIVDHMPIESVQNFSQVSTRMRDIVKDVPWHQRKAFNQIVAKPESVERSLEIMSIASGKGKLPARVLQGTYVKKTEVEKPLLNPNRAEADASLIRIDDARREDLAEAMRGPVPYTFGIVSIA